MSDYITYSEDSLLGRYARAMSDSLERPDDRPLARPELKLVHSAGAVTPASAKPKRRRKRALRVIDGGRE